MQSIKKEFSKGERAAILILCVLIVAMIYYIAVVRPVRKGIESAHQERDDLEMQVTILDAQVAKLNMMQQELEDMKNGDRVVSMMPSYNAGKQEVDFLHTTLAGTEDYYIGFSALDRDGDQIRRNFSLQFRSSDYQSAVGVIDKLENSEIRCLIGDVSVSPADNETRNIMSGQVNVNCTATFYETMYDGVEDKELPEEEIVIEDIDDEASE